VPALLPAQSAQQSGAPAWPNSLRTGNYQGLFLFFAPPASPRFRAMRERASGNPFDAIAATIQ
jgi:hypothetical protein